MRETSGLSKALVFFRGLTCHSIREWFVLGYSMAPLLQFANGAGFTRAAAQLVEEYEYCFGNIAEHSMVRPCCSITRQRRLTNAGSETIKGKASRDRSR